MRRLGVFVAVLAVFMVPAIGTAGAADTFLVQGELDGVYPGFDGTLDAKVTNTLDVAIHVEEVSGAPTSTGVSGCDPSELTIATMTTSIDLVPGESATVPMRIRMAANAPDACQGVTFALAFAGTSLAQDRAPGSLAFTGTDVGILVLIGAGLLLVGVAFVRRARAGALR
jgi:hypothetical protein